MENKEGYKLVDLVFFTGREDQKIYLAVVYFYGDYHRSLLKIPVTQHTFEELQSYLDRDVRELITLVYNNTKEAYVPTINIK